MIDINTLAKSFEKKEVIDNKTPWYYPQHVGSESYRWCLCAPSGGGKTSVLLNSLLEMRNWDKIYLVSSTLEQPKYKAFISVLQKAQEFINNQLQKKLPRNAKYEPFKMLYTYGTLQEFLDEGGIDLLNSQYRNVLILDDVLSELMMSKNNQVMTDIFIKLRHHNTSVAILTQGYINLPKIIRQNCNVFSLFGLNKRAIRSICLDLSGEVDTDELYTAYERCISTNKYAFLHISKQSPDVRTRYRCGLKGIGLINR